MRHLLTILLLALLATSVHAKTHPDVSVVFLGDSNTWIGGDECNDSLGWSSWFVKQFAPGQYRSYARSGATWTCTPLTQRATMDYSEVLGDNNVIYNQVYRLVDSVKTGRQVKPDLIFIMCGTNDAWFIKRRPHAFDKTASQALALKGIDDLKPSLLVTMADAVCQNCLFLRRNIPEAKIVLIAPPQTTKATLDNQKKLVDLLVDCSQALDLPLVRLDINSGITSEREKAGLWLTSDGTHTNADGAKRCADHVIQCVEPLFD